MDAPVQESITGDNVTVKIYAVVYFRVVKPEDSVIKIKDRIRATPMVSQTTIVFDAKQAPPGLPHQLDHGGITVIFARGYDDADELIEELIASNSTPRRLTVVSSDHRIQRAARRRRGD